MAVFPLTASAAQVVQPDGTIQVTATVTDGDGVVRRTSTQSFPGDVAAMAVVEWITDERHTAMAFLKASDLPASFTVQIGLDTSLRNLDLL